MPSGSRWARRTVVGAALATGALAVPLVGAAAHGGKGHGHGHRGGHQHGHHHGKGHGQHHGKHHGHQRGKGRDHDRWSWRRSDRGGKAFNHVGTFAVPDNLPAGAPADTVTAAEIVDVSQDGRTALYTDAPTGRLGFIDIGDADEPEADGVVDVGGEPTSVATYGRYALVAVNTRTDPDGDGPLNAFDNPSGDLVVVDVTARTVVRRIALGGQPDSITVSPDKRYAAIVIENERDEDENDGLIPQAPGGGLLVLDLSTLLSRRPNLRSVNLAGIAAYAPSDPEPEYVDINDKNEAVVSLQENNHLAIVDLKKAKVIRHFSAGSVTLHDVDATEDGLGPQRAGVIDLSESITRRREPDAVAWIDKDTFATANEGDYTDEHGEEGGSRSFTLFNAKGWVEYESGARFEHEVVRAGHYPEARSENKGNEPEGVEVGTFGGRTYLFIGSERANVVGVYELKGGKPVFKQLLPTGIGPEGIKAIPSRGLLAVSSETDLIEDGVNLRSVVTLYRLQDRDAAYPMLESGNEGGGVPIPWVAISGLAGDPRDGRTLWAVSDSVLAQAYVYKLDVSQKPARIVKRIPVGGVGVADQTTGDFDLEGIAARPAGGFWLASEGRTNVGSSRPNVLVRIDGAGAIQETAQLPASLVANATSSGFEGVAVTGSAASGDETVWVAIQREWRDDAAGVVKLGRYDVASRAWTFASYPLDPVPAARGAWVGLSELTLLPDGHTVAIVERDNLYADEATVKRVYGVDLTDPSVAWKAHGETLDTVRKTLLRDVLSDLDAHSISVPDKLEGLGITKHGRVYLATDNDGVEDNLGETLFFGLGPAWRAFG